MLAQLSGFSYSSPAKLISEGEFVAVSDGNGKHVLIQVTNAQSINHGGPINGVVFSSFIEPTVSLFSPLDEQVGVAVSSNVVVAFNEPIVQGIGAIVLKTAAGATVATYDAATSSNLSFSGSTLTINPTVDLIYSTSYKVEFAAGAIKDLAGNSYAGTTTYNFTTVAAPTPIATLSPGFPSVTEGNSGTKLMTMTVTLSAAASTAVSVAYATSNGQAIAGSDYTATSGILSFAIGETTKTFTVPILGDTAFEGDESFFINLTSATGAVLGTNGTAAAIGTITNDDSPGAPPDTTAPSASTFSPLDEATDIAISSNIVLTFNEAIARGVGNIVLKTAAGVTVATYDAASSTNLSVTGSTLTINPTSDLSNGTGYKVEFAAGTIKDLAGNSYAGTTSYNFTTTTNVYEVESNESVGTANTLALATPVIGQILTLADVDYYKVAVSGAGLLSLTVDVPTNSSLDVYKIGLYGSTGTLVAAFTTGKDQTFEASVAAAGDYYVKVETGSYYKYESSAVNPYTLTTGFSRANSLPTGSVTVTGTPTQGQVLTVSNTLADPDGLGTISYQWKAAGVNIAGATTNTYTLTQAEVGKLITVIASYTDALGTAESKISGPTSTVAATSALTGSTGNDSLTSGTGNDTIDGGAGTDAVVYSGGRASFSLTKAGNGFTVTDNTGAAGSDSLQNIERIKFSDGSIALDVGATQPAGQTAMLLGAVLPGRLVFDVSKQSLLGAAIDLFDQGFSLQTLSGAVTQNNRIFR